MANKKIIKDKEIEECPECSSSNIDADFPEFYDNGKMSRNIECKDCNDFLAVEFWVLDRTEVEE